MLVNFRVNSNGGDKGFRARYKQGIISYLVI